MKQKYSATIVDMHPRQRTSGVRKHPRKEYCRDKWKDAGLHVKQFKDDPITGSNLPTINDFKPSLTLHWLNPIRPLLLIKILRGDLYPDIGGVMTSLIFISPQD